MSSEQIKNVAVGVVFLLFQVVLFRHLDIYNIQPDVVLIFLVWYMSNKSRTASLLMGGFLGFGQDFFLSLWGVNMFTKTLLVYSVARFIYRTGKKRLLIGQVFLTVFLTAILHNLIFLGLSFFIQSYSAEAFFWRHLFGNSFYTALIASFIHLFRTQR